MRGHANCTALDGGTSSSLHEMLRAADMMPLYDWIWKKKTTSLPNVLLTFHISLLASCFRHMRSWVSVGLVQHPKQTCVIPCLPRGSPCTRVVSMSHCSATRMRRRKRRLT